MPECQHCGEPGEHATTTDNRSIQADACYGCRNRHYDARQWLETAARALHNARELLDMEPTDRTGQKAASEIVTVEARLTDARRNLDQPGQEVNQ